jgi:hypothetical protein
MVEGPSLLKTRYAEPLRSKGLLYALVCGSPRCVAYFASFEFLVGGGACAS